MSNPTQHKGYVPLTLLRVCDDGGSVSDSYVLSLSGKLSPKHAREACLSRGNHVLETLIIRVLLYCKCGTYLSSGLSLKKNIEAILFAQVVLWKMNIVGVGLIHEDVLKTENKP